jgi:hypothetical protein
MDEMQIVIAASALGFAAVGAGITWVFMSAKVKLLRQEIADDGDQLQSWQRYYVETQHELDALRPDAEKHRNRLADERQRRAAKKVVKP